MAYGLRSLAVVLVLAALSAAPAQAQSQALTAKAPEAADMLVTATDKGAVRVIVAFAAAINTDTLATEAGLAAAQRTVADGQDAILYDHFGSATDPLDIPGFRRGLRRLLISPAFAITVTGAELEALAADPRVVSIVIDHESEPQLIQTLPLIGMPAAYADKGTGLGGWVAILDTGIQELHEFVIGRVGAEACFSATSGVTENSLCGNGEPTQFGFGAASATIANCSNGAVNLCDHGMHVAGIAAGSNTGPGAGEPTTGVAKQSNIVAIQVFHRVDSAMSCSPNATPCLKSYDSDQMAALEWIFANARTFPGGGRLAAINISIGGSVNYDDTCDDLGPGYAADLQILRDAGVATVISAGNNSSTTGISWPACLSRAVAVASSDKSDNISSFSNISPYVDLFAPGSGILSSITGGGYGTMSGTSMAAPHVTGAIAAIRSACPDIAYDGTGLDAILSALRSVGPLITDNRAGGTIIKRRLQVDAAINRACLDPTAAVALDPLTLFGIAGLAGLGWRFRRRA